MKLLFSNECTIIKEQEKQYELRKLYLAGPNLPFGSDSSNLYESNKGNFLELLGYVAKFDQNGNDVATPKRVNICGKLCPIF